MANKSPNPSVDSLQKESAEPSHRSSDVAQEAVAENRESPIFVEEKQTASSSPVEPAKPPPKGPPPVYSAFSPARKRFILAVTTIAGFFGPFAGNIYLPALPVLQKEFGVSVTAINASVTVFMAVFAIGVSLPAISVLSRIRSSPLFILMPAFSARDPKDMVEDLP